MRGNNILGIIFAYINGEKVPNLTKNRIMASVPFAGRYRMVDFPLSNMVNSGINKVGVITNLNYQSLMDHLGSGKAWDLSRKREGLYLLPPFGAEHFRTDGKVESLHSIRRFLQASSEEYVLLSDCDIICNINYLDVLNFHIEKNADITVIYRHGQSADNTSSCVYTFDPEGRAIKLKVSEKKESDVDLGMNKYLIRRTLLIDLVDECISTNVMNFDSAVLFKCIDEYKVYGYEFEGVNFQISTNENYFAANMALMNSKVRAEIFNPKKPIYTKVRDEMPAKYGLESKVENSLVADGCKIEGSVENCILFRGVYVGKNSKLKNCIVMQDTVIEEGAKLECVITDKNVLVEKNKEIIGSSKYHIYVEKGSVV